MSTVTNINPEKEPIPQSWVPRVILGGKEPPSEFECWLERLPVGTVFLTHYMTMCWGDLYELIWKGSKFYLLHHTLGDGTVRDCYVIPSMFCNERLDYEILNNPPKEEETNNERTVEYQPGMFVFERNRTD